MCCRGGWKSEAAEIVVQVLVKQGVTNLLNQNVSLDQIARNGNAV